ncbi:hypothetical protein FA041_13700 [Escherichia coli]|nr:hypothetical protein [Escherichia coli]MBW9312897.1 hypothetical protein [Escherichia coli]
MEAPAKPALISNVTGLDMGLAHFVIKSDGNKIASPRHLINASRNLRRKQKALSRKKRERKQAQSQNTTCSRSRTGSRCPCRFPAQVISRNC